MINAKDLIARIPKSDKKDLEFIAKQIQSYNHESYIIGGSVRDLLLEKTPHEYDLATSMLPNEVKKAFKRVIETGIQHGTVTVMLGDNSYEVTTFRKDIDYTDGRRPDKIEFGSTLSEDMKRRDFTMNAIALDILSEKIIDENDGISDIKKKLIRTIGNPLERFGEDGLRPIRAIRFLSTLGFEIEPETYKAIFETRSVTEKISRERFHDELNKILVSKKPSLGIEELFKNKIFNLFTKNSIKSNLPDNFSNLNKLTNSPLGLRLAYLLNLIIEDSEKLTTAELVLRDFRYSKLNIRESLFYLELFQLNFQLENITFVEVRLILSKIITFTGKREIDLVLNGFISYLEIHFQNDYIETFKNKVITILESSSPLTLKELAVNGNIIIEKFPDLDKRKIGSILASILDWVITDPNNNSEENIFNFILGNK